MHLENGRPGSIPASPMGAGGGGGGHTSEVEIGSPVVTIPGPWRYRVSDGTGWPGVSTLWLGEGESFICSFYLSARQHVQLSEEIRPWDTPACRWDVTQPTNNKTTRTTLQAYAPRFRYRGLTAFYLPCLPVAFRVSRHTRLDLFAQVSAGPLPTAV